jgi:predicted O-methyltransferase YrrM
VYSSYQLAQKYFRYYFTALNGKGHGMHSPFVFDFILRVLNNGNNYVAPIQIEKLRAELKGKNTLLTLEDLGAGSRLSSSKQKSIGHLASTAVKPKRYGELLFRLVTHYQPKTIIELGTSLGVTTAYLASANPSAEVITIEGAKEIYKLANENFKKLGINNIQAFNGNFDDLLPTIMRQLSNIDLAYIDGNHRLEPTLNYFHQLLQKTGNNSILIFDDIHWSKEMEEAWEAIKNHPSVLCTIDIFFLGFVFFRREFKEKQHFTIRF